MTREEEAREAWIEDVDRHRIRDSWVCETLQTEVADMPRFYRMDALRYLEEHDPAAAQVCALLAIGAAIDLQNP